MPTEVFAQAPTHHLRVVFVVDLPLALLIPVLRRDHIDLHSHRLHPARPLIPKATRLVAHHHSLGYPLLLCQPTTKNLRMKSLRRLRLTVIDLAHHPVVPPVHVDPYLDYSSFLRYGLILNVRVVECGVLAAHSTTHDHLQNAIATLLRRLEQLLPPIPAYTSSMPLRFDFRVKAVLFDLDGTIGSTLPLCIAAFRESIEPLAARSLTDEEIVATFGPSEEGTIAVLLPEKQAEGLTQYLLRYEELHCRWPSPFEGIPQILTYLKEKDVFVGLITGKGERSTELTLKNYGLENYFDVVKTGASSGPVKDRRIEEVIKEFSLDREEILYVGDAPSDLKACRDCNIKVAAAAWAPAVNATELEQTRPDLLFSSVEAFSDFIRKEPE